MIFFIYIVDKNPKEDKLRKYDSCIPDDLMISLKQAEQPKEYLGPPSKKTLAGIKPAVPVRIEQIKTIDKIIS